MADGLNQVRAIRITELVSDYNNLQRYVSSVRAQPRPEEAAAEGYLLLRSCVAEAQALLAQRFQALPSDQGNDEETKMHLRRIIVDAAARRFKMQRIYLRVVAALRWVNSRTAVLQGQRAEERHAPALRLVSQALRQELMSITDARVELALRTADSAAGKWLLEDPSLGMIQRVLNGRN